MFRSLPVLALTGVLLVAGCATPAAEPAAPPSSSPSPTADARDAVTVVKESFQRSFDAKSFTMTAHISVGKQQSLDMTARVDLAADAMVIALEGMQTPVEVVKLGDDLFIKSGQTGKKPYLRLQVSKLNASSPMRNSLDITQHSGLLGGVVTAEKRDGVAAGSVTYTGIADIKKAVEAAPDKAKGQLEPVSRLATNGSAVPYSVTVDAEGRLTDLSYTIETASMGDMVSEIQLTALGEPATVDRPEAKDVEDATEEQYAYF
ncbi:hypothetical protein SAMN05421812_1116 [Asanoa hainanensis]|uniref:Lipoprotein LprG n=1 Tax=Asanoa hainanensis TaxID=560556 RepID=A0A239NU84_9ACTN|nr:hypothetical protein [Asanoa hainanensis]SNT58481.1 hypothetical protein SAMN05421812_1116 [Asanoa hainanensis]